MPPMSSNKFEKYCEGIVSVLRDEKKCLAAFEGAAEILAKALDDNFARDKAKDASLLSLAESLC